MYIYFICIHCITFKYIYGNNNDANLNNRSPVEKTHIPSLLHPVCSEPHQYEHLSALAQCELCQESAGIPEEKRKNRFHYI